MFAVIKTGGKQYRVVPGDVITVEKVTGDEGAEVTFDNILMVGEDGKAPTVGTPTVANATVTGEVLEQARSDKVLVFKKKRRKDYKRTHGHRQTVTVLRITGVNGTGAKKTAAKTGTETDEKAESTAEAKPKAAAKKAAPKKAPAKKAAPSKTTAAKSSAKSGAKKPAAKKPAAKKPAAKKS